jgi:hypothetical protein
LFLLLSLSLSGLGMVVSATAEERPPEAGSRYESTAKILVRIPLERRGAENPDPDRLLAKDFTAIEIATLASERLIAKTADEIGLERLFEGVAAEAEPTLDQAVALIRRGLRLRNSKNSPSIIALKYRNHDADLAVEVLKTLIEQYFESHLVRRRPLLETQADAERLVLAARKEVEQREIDLRELGQDPGRSKFSMAEQKASLLSAAEELKAAEELLEKISEGKAETTAGVINLTVVQQPSKPRKLAK